MNVIHSKANVIHSKANVLASKVSVLDSKADDVSNNHAVVVVVNIADVISAESRADMNKALSHRILPLKQNSLCIMLNKLHTIPNQMLS